MKDVVITEEESALVEYDNQEEVDALMEFLRTIHR